LVGRVTCAPGNAGTLRVGENRQVAATDAAGIVALAISERADLAVLGPDAAVAAGVGDALELAGVRCFGPSREAGRLESSKSFAKRLMQRAAIPTPAFVVFDDPESAARHLRQRTGPVVVKADGLAMGKGTFVCAGPEEALTVVDRLLRGHELGPAGERVVIEDCLFGEEASFFAICDGDTAVMLPPARDYKRAFDGDLGPNTGGMGSFAPSPVAGWPVLNQLVRRQVVEPALAEMRRLGCPYRGCLYVGAMLVGEGIQVLEFNARFGDPETEVQLPLLPDLVPLFWQSAEGRLQLPDPQPLGGACVGVVAAREPYPAPVEVGGELAGMDAAEELGCLVFQMGTRLSAQRLAEVSGGRVLICTAVGADPQEARRLAYLGLARISFPGMRYRQDIAA
jgi:phosphoribosylamine--glycine ligase